MTCEGDGEIKMMMLMTDDDEDDDDDDDDDYVPRELTYNCAFIKGTPGYIFPPLQC